MLSEKYRILKSGTDIRGIASEGVEGESVNLTDEVVCEIAGGFALWLEKKCNKKSGDLTVAVGRDCRISGEHIADLVINTLIKYGVKVYDCALSSTPAMFMTTVDLGDGDAPAALVTVDVYATEPVEAGAFKQMTPQICAALERELGIDPARIYIRYGTTPDFGWNNMNF